jgi:hypothetical protein
MAFILPPTRALLNVTGGGGLAHHVAGLAVEPVLRYVVAAG